MPSQEAPWEELLASPNYNASAHARCDLESGLVDARLVETLLALVRAHRISVSLIKTGHPMGAVTPSGRPNDHFYYRATDVTAVDGRDIGDDPIAAAAIDVGRILHALPIETRPDRIMGPDAWQRALGYSREDGFISDPFHNEIHADHLHLGFSSGP